MSYLGRWILEHATVGVDGFLQIDLFNYQGSYTRAFICAHSMGIKVAS